MKMIFRFYIWQRHRSHVESNAGISSMCVSLNSKPGASSTLHSNDSRETFLLILKQIRRKLLKIH
jgi:hypothetical protein